jgi:DNA-binding transcriptional MerR regulator
MEMEYLIGKVAENTGLSAYTIRYYEKEGLLPPVKRNEKGIRLFGENDIQWIKLINCMRETGMSLGRIKHIVDLSLESDHTIPSRKALLEEHKEKIQNQMDELQRHLDKIDKKIEWYDKGEKNCCNDKK